MEWMLNDEGLFEEYDDTYDVVIHCDSEETRNEVLADLKAVNDRVDVLDKIRAEIEDLTYYCWEVSPRTVIDDVLEIIDKYKAESEDKE